MSIQKCKKCSARFSYKTISKSIRNNFSAVVCEECKTIHHVDSIYMSIVFIVSLVAPWLFRSYTTGLGEVFQIIIALVWIVIMVSIAPYYMRYHIER